MDFGFFKSFIFVCRHVPCDLPEYEDYDEEKDYLDLKSNKKILTMLKKYPNELKSERYFSDIICILKNKKR